QTGSSEKDAVRRATHGFVQRLAESYYVGRSGRTLRVDFGFEVDPRAMSTLDSQPELLKLIDNTVMNTRLVQSVGGAVSVHLVGETATYADIHHMRARDFRVVAIAAILSVYLVLVGLLRAPLQACLLVAATLLTYLTTYGATWLIFRGVYGVAGLSDQLDLILFIIILSLGQDYNIYVVARIREERLRQDLDQAVRTAVAKTGRVVSSCGLIMAAAFASMMSGSLLVMKEFAVALSLGILIDTFLVRPLLVPAAILLTSRWFNQSAAADAVRASDSTADRH
ncbi:MAG: MMPL family transporter, partial [Planctomycetes bacterium]|nr:MMPL family transporter [Planctomycetota bacterium]